MVKICKGCLGSWTFAIGLLVAIILGAFGPIGLTIGWILLAIGLIIGIVGTMEREVMPHIIAGVVLIIVSTFSKPLFVDFGMVQDILTALVFVAVPATVLMAIRSIFVKHKHK